MLFLDIFDGIDLTSVSGIVSFISSLFTTLFEIVSIIIFFPVTFGGFFPSPFGLIITTFLYLFIVIILYKFFVNKD